MNNEDKQLIASAKADKEKFGLLYLKYTKRVYRYILNRARHDRNIALDLMQETFTRAFSHLGQFTDQGYSYLTYLLKIARNLLINQSRRPKNISLDQLLEDQKWQEPASDDSEIFIDKQDNSNLVGVSLSKLKPNEKKLYELFYLKDWPIKKIAKYFHKTENAIKLSLGRLRRKIKDKIGKRHL